MILLARRCVFLKTMVSLSASLNRSFYLIEKIINEDLFFICWLGSVQALALLPAQILKTIPVF